MRAAVILGLGSSTRDLKPFQKNSNATWLMGMPAASCDADVVLVFGGDGTVHRHLTQLVRLRLPVLVVPAGSGNDFARALSLRRIRDSVAAWKTFCSDKRNLRTVDLGVITQLSENSSPQGLKLESGAGLSGESAPLRNRVSSSTPGEFPFFAQHYFCSVAGCGLDAEVARRAHSLPGWLRAHGGYALSLPGALYRFAAPFMTILSPKSEPEFVIRGSKATLVLACANSPTYGGGMKIAPGARIDDGLLDICHIGEIHKLKVSSLFPIVYFGAHLKMHEVDYFQAERLRLHTQRALDVYADGEYVCQTPVEIGVAPGALQVVVPEPPK